MYTRVWVLCGMRCNGWSDTRWPRWKKSSRWRGIRLYGVSHRTTTVITTTTTSSTFVRRQRSASADRFLREAVSAGFDSGIWETTKNDNPGWSQYGRSVGRSGITRPKVFPSVERRREKGCAPVTRTGGALTGCDKQGVVVVYSSTLYRCSLYP